MSPDQGSGMSVKMRGLRLGNSPLFILATAIAVYLFVLFPQFGEGPFSFDAIYSLGRAKQAAHDPFSIFEPSFTGRFSPSSYLALAPIYHFFGLNPAVYTWLDGTLHTLNTFLLFCLVHSLLGSFPIPAVLASIFFLFSSTQWGVVGDIVQSIRLGCLSFSLLSLLFFVRFLLTKRKVSYVLSLSLLVISFGFAEDSLCLPFLLLAMMLLVFPRENSLAEKFVLATPFFIASFAFSLVSIYFSRAPQGWNLKLGPHVFLNLLNLMRYFIQFLLVPRPEFIPISGIPGTFLRLLPALLVSTFVWVVWKWRQDRITNPFSRPLMGRVLLFGLTWMVITSFLYALRPMEGTWQGRYLYFPGMGEAIVVGIILHQGASALGTLEGRTSHGMRRLLKGCFLGIIFYGLGLNVSTTSLMVRKFRSDFNPATRDELPFLFSVISGIREQYESPREILKDLILVIEGSPLSIPRLKEWLLTHYLSLPAEIMEAKEGRPLMTQPLAESYRVLYMKWHKGRLTMTAYPKMGSWTSGMDLE